MKRTAVLLLFAVAGLALLAGGYYLVTEVLFGPSPVVRAALKSGSDVQVTWEEGRSWLVFHPAQGAVKAGLVAYPENYQDIRMYAPLCRRIAGQGYLVVMLSRAKRLPPTLDEETRRVAAVMQKYQGATQNWFLGAHSWEAMVAAAVANRDPARFAGVVMWGGRLSAETSLANSGLPVLQVYGTRDEQNENLMLNNQPFLPPGTTYVAIEGGNRVGFADFGPMPRDVGAGITPAEQQDQTAAATTAFMDKYRQP